MLTIINTILLLVFFVWLRALKKKVDAMDYRPIQELPIQGRPVSRWDQPSVLEREWQLFQDALNK